MPLTAFGGGFFTDDGKGLVFKNALFKDTYGLGYLDLDNPGEAVEVPLAGLVHSGAGEFEGMAPLKNGHSLLFFNIDGSSWVYEAEYDAEARVMRALYVLVGQGVLAEGVMEAIDYDHATDSYAIAFSTATSPTQIYTIEGEDRDRLVRHTNETILGIPRKCFPAGKTSPTRHLTACGSRPGYICLRRNWVSPVNAR